MNASITKSTSGRGQAREARAQAQEARSGASELAKRPKVVEETLRHPARPRTSVHRLLRRSGVEGEIKRDVPYLDLTPPTITLTREALARAVRALDEMEGLALVRAAYGFDVRQARVAWSCMVAGLF